MFQMHIVFCFIAFGCQHQCHQLAGKTCLRNDLLCVEWDVKPYSLTHSLKRWHVQIDISIEDNIKTRSNTVSGFES